MKKGFCSLLLVFICVTKLQAQDPQYSQYYANALYLSPAFAGADQNSRAIFATRYQWPGLDAAFISNTFSADHFFSNYKSGVGLIATTDYFTAANMRSSEAGIIYAYQTKLSKKIVFRPALQLSYVNRSIDFSKLTFGAQYNDNGFQGGSTQETFNNNTISYLDVSAGGLLYATNYWIGCSTHHLNTPDQSFTKGDSPLPLKASLFGGYKFSFTPEWRKRHINPEEDKSITATFLYKMQGKSDQLDLGVYGRYNAAVVGLWYRGIPVKLYEGESSNNDAIVFLIGFVYNGFTMGYSYDYTISKLYKSSAGSHELTLSYAIKNKPSKKIQKRPVCPKF